MFVLYLDQFFPFGRRAVPRTVQWTRSEDREGALRQWSYSEISWLSLSSQTRKIFAKHELSGGDLIQNILAELILQTVILFKNILANLILQIWSEISWLKPKLTVSDLIQKYLSKPELTWTVIYSEYLSLQAEWSYSEISWPNQILQIVIFFTIFAKTERRVCNLFRNVSFRVWLTWNVIMAQWFPIQELSRYLVRTMDWWSWSNMFLLDCEPDKRLGCTSVQSPWKTQPLGQRNI
jgi:hypothetical protein